MSAEKLLVVICVTAGRQDQVKTEIQDVLDEQAVRYKLVAIASPPDMQGVLKKVKLSEYKAVAVYGGDGTIIAALKVFGQGPLPVLMLPGGTANVLAKYYGLPSSVDDCLRLYISNAFVSERVDIAMVNGEPLILDIHMGLWTEAIKSTPRKLKKRVGEAAYGWSAVQKAKTAKLQTYEFAINDKPARVVQGYTLLIANQGNHNILSLPLFPRDHAPGLVQIAIMKSIKLRRLLAWFVCRLFGNNLDSVIEVHRARKIVITKSPKSVLSDDDSRKVELPITVSAGEFSARIFVPPKPSDTNRLVVFWRRSELQLHRVGQRIRTFMGIGPVLRYSHVAPNLYLGGKYTSKTYKVFESWGVTGIVSMRRTQSPPAPKQIELLSLPTTDWHPPTLTALQQGVAFMEKHISSGGSVYVHCQLGEGRGPTMAAAYLITKGFSADEAIVRLTKYRPIIQPNAAQRKRLAEFQQLYNKSLT